MLNGKFRGSARFSASPNFEFGCDKVSFGTILLAGDPRYVATHRRDDVVLRS
jgi:hypothetical protein